jgi:putative acetyltransferase
MIRQMLNEDIDAVMDVWLKTNISAHDFIPENYWIGNYQAVMGEYLPAAENYVFIQNEQVCAFISVITKSLIGALFVSSESQGKGIGGKLLDYCKNLYPHLDVAVYADNHSAIAFYQKHGFVLGMEQVNKDSGHNEVIMSWDKQ